MLEPREDSYRAQIAVMFPGVGSQYTGMGRTLFDAHESYRRTLEEASDSLGLDVASLCFEESNRRALSSLDVAQLVLCAVEVAAFRVAAEQFELSPAFALGYSLGEYAALCSVGALDLPTTLRLLRDRSQIIHEVIAHTPGTMAWVTNIDSQTVARVCRTIRARDGLVWVSGFDAPQKVAISGNQASIQLAADELVRRGGLCIPIKMSGPFHCPLMRPASEAYAALLRNTPFSQPRAPVISNYSGDTYRDTASLRHGLSEHLSSAVLWQASVQKLLTSGVHRALEVGPKTVLQYLTASASSRIRVLPCGEAPDLEQVRHGLVVPRSSYNEVASSCLQRIAATPVRGASGAGYDDVVRAAYTDIASTVGRSEASPGFDARRLLHVLRLFESTLRAKNYDGEAILKETNALLGSRTISA